MKWVVLLATCCVVFAVTKAEDDEEKYAKWKKDLCENKNRTYNEEMNACFQTEPQTAIDASIDCVNRALPAAEGSLVELLEVACKEKSVYLKVAECNAEYDADEEYRKKVEVSAETVACYDAVLEKYGFPLLSASK